MNRKYSDSYVAIVAVTCIVVSFGLTSLFARSHYGERISNVKAESEQKTEELNRVITELKSENEQLNKEIENTVIQRNIFKKNMEVQADACKFLLGTHKKTKTF